MQIIFKNNAHIKLFGSQANGLSIESSDIDLLIEGFDRENKQQIISNLQQLLKVLTAFRWVRDYKPIYTASVPVPFTTYRS